ncbi:MAG TPA: MDR family MFS transporter [Anaerolineae bacterium]
MSRKRLIVITVGVMLSLFVASVEGTVVATAMPTIVAQLGGLAAYSWVFSAYMLASTTTVPIYGKLSDLYGRRPVYGVAMALFLAGSILCGRAGSMPALIAARALQGLGAGGLMPLAFTIIGDLFTLEERARIQGLFSSVWGVSSIIGPLLGGFLVDRISWRWVFYFNLGPGLLAWLLVWVAWRDRERRTETGRPAIDYAGAVLLSAGVVALLLGLFELGTPISGGLLGLAAVLLAALAWVERRAVDPLLPLPLFRNRLFAVACAHGLLAGCAMFGGINYIPLFVQSVLGASATLAGATLTPQSLAWVIASLFSSRLLLRVTSRSLALAGMVLLTAGMVAMLGLSTATHELWLMVDLGLMGVGMGLAYPAFLIAVQSSVSKATLGAATSTLQFSRSIGGALGVSIMGAVLSARLSGNLQATGIDPGSVSLARLLDPVASAAQTGLDGAVRVALAGAIRDIFFVAVAASLLGLLVTTLGPRERLASTPSVSVEL